VRRVWVPHRSAAYSAGEAAGVPRRAAAGEDAPEPPPHIGVRRISTRQKTTISLSPPPLLFDGFGTLPPRDRESATSVGD
jgi:hypothetical protein